MDPYSHQGNPLSRCLTEWVWLCASLIDRWVCVCACLCLGCAAERAQEDQAIRGTDTEGEGTGRGTPTHTEGPALLSLSFLPSDAYLTPVCALCGCLFSRVPPVFVSGCGHAPCLPAGPGSPPPQHGTRLRQHHHAGTQHGTKHIPHFICRPNTMQHIQNETIFEACVGRLTLSSVLSVFLSCQGVSRFGGGASLRLNAQVMGLGPLFKVPIPSPPFFPCLPLLAFGSSPTTVRVVLLPLHPPPPLSPNPSPCPPPASLGGPKRGQGRPPGPAPSPEL
jgi:hypothetical protein